MDKKNSREFSVKRQRGIYKTPFTTVKHMVQIISQYFRNSREMKILDPAVGDGVFVQALLEYGVPSENIYAHDIDEERILPLIKLGIHAECKDTLLDDYTQMDFVIGNPPFKSRRNSKYIKKNKNELEKKYGNIGLYNLYSLFLVNAIQNIKGEGVICMIIEDAFLTNRYYSRLRKVLLDSCKIIELKLAPWKLFHSSKADVRTVIITIKKKIKDDEYGINSSKVDINHQMRLVDRLSSENEYENPPNLQLVNQSEYRLMPDQKFFIGIPLPLIRLVQNPPLRFGDIAMGGTGISTGNDGRFLKPAMVVKKNPAWVGFYKSGHRTPYYYKTPFYIEKDYAKNVKADPQNFLVRNEQFYFREGITCSSVGRRFSAAYLPPGNLFGVNANFFFDCRDDLFYCLGFLNSKLTQYLARKVINRSNIIATSYIKELPFIQPEDEQKTEISSTVQKIVKSLELNPKKDFKKEQKMIDDSIFNLFKIANEIKTEILEFNQNITNFV
ncbi:MAG: Eco57I restriction-modification methylase domain-containing protein [Candidatus Hodarchaeales archaeon]